jgi:hypothetical protein
MAGDGSRIAWVGGSWVRNGERPCKVLCVVGDAQLKVVGHEDGGRQWGIWVRLWGRWEALIRSGRF